MSLYRYQLVRKNEERGFTLLELLVVIAIIGLLSSVALASLNNARAKARDATRLAMVREMRTAMELYFSEYGQYPQAHNDANTALAPFGFSPLPATYDGILAATVRNTDLRRFYPAEPRDPLGVPTSEYGYTYWTANPAGYAILLYLESTGDFCEVGVNKPSSVFGVGVPDC